MKAQTVGEYIMTYGWAILIVIIVGLALNSLGLFNPETHDELLPKWELPGWKCVDWECPEGFRQLSEEFCVPDYVSENITYVLEDILNATTCTEQHFARGRI